MRFTGDVDIRFHDEQSVEGFVSAFRKVEVMGKTICIGRKTPRGEANLMRYAVSFKVTGELELEDILGKLKEYGKLMELTWKTIKNTAIKNGQHSAYLDVKDL